MEHDMRYSLVDAGTVKVLTVLVNDQMLVATSDTHSNFNNLVAKVLENDESVVLDFTPEKRVAERFEALSERVSVRVGQVYLDGDAVNDALSEQILRFLDEDVEDWEPLVLFFEKVQQNPNEHSREQLFRWLARHKFTLTTEGDIVGYKGVSDDLKSLHDGPAIVNGVPMTGYIPNQPGSVIEMPRSEVNHDPSQGCSTGLHVANWAYASDWGTKTLEVHVNPRDVVSVPTDSGDAKVRCCRYTVVQLVTEPYEGPVLEAEETEEEHFGFKWNSFEPTDDFCEYCGTSCEDYCLDDEDYVGDDPWVAAKADTRQNYLSQVRGPGGRFGSKTA
jgi:hypothetical protein